MRISSQSESPGSILPSIDYLLIGHLSEDRTPNGITLGGTVCYSGLTAHALKHTVGVVTAASEIVDLSPIDDLHVVVKPSPQSTSFENVYTAEGRVQTVYSQAVDLLADDVPPEWLGAPLVHIAPLIGEFTKEILRPFRESFIGLTPQGLMREWDSAGRVSALPWETATELIQAADAVVFGIEDVDMNEEAADAMARLCSLIAVTYGAGGARVWAEAEWRSFPAPDMDEMDATGAGDIFAAVFFSRLNASGNPWMAAEEAVRLASASVSRSGLAGVPTEIEVQEVLSGEGA